MRVCASAMLVLLGGCSGADPFVCATAADCASGASGGMCEPTGYCSFPDEQCDSGRRYGSHAPSELAGTCVPVDVDGDTTQSDPSVADGPDSQADDAATTMSGVGDTTQGLDDSSSGVSSLGSVSLDSSGRTSSESVGDSSTTDSPVIQVEYAATIAVCTEDTIFDPQHCALETGVDQITIDLSDSDMLVSNIWVRFDLDDQLLGAEVMGAEVVFVVGPDALDGSTNTGELWTTEPFDLASLSSVNPATLELVGDDLGPVRIGAEVAWSIPVDVVIAGEPLHLAMLPVTDDGLDVWDANSATPPRLVVTAQ